MSADRTPADTLVARPPLRSLVEDLHERRERAPGRLLDVLPDSPRKPYDMYDVIGRVVDDGDWFDLKPRWAHASAASSRTTPPTRRRAS